MKRLIAAALVLASGSALANSGSIQFRGQITGATCPIDIVDPSVPGVPTPVINVGTFSDDYFDANGKKTPGRPFALWIRDGASCGFNPTDEVDVTFSGQDGETANHYLLKQGPGMAEKIALAIIDRSQNEVKPGTASMKYPVNDQGETQLNFNAALVSTDNNVVPGGVAADISFVVNLP